ncbi:MFS transporter [Streptomyces sviceus]|uniref:MFS transporter n=1 Tax=Streptomyces sviceus TaxID=285530 RepID=UPI0036A2E231
MGGLAPNPAVLITARAGQGIAAAMIGPTAIALMTASFHEGPQRTKALAVNGALLSLGFVIGTIGGGLITSGLSWRWTMLIMVFLGALIALGAVALLPKDGARIATRLDVPGAILASGGLFALVYGISTGADADWTSGSTLGSLIAAVALIPAFVLVESRHPAPLASLELLNRSTVKWSFVVGFVTFGMCGGTTVLLSLYMQDVLGYSALATGFGFLAEGATALVAGTVASKLIGSLGTCQTMVLGLLAQTVGTGFMVFLPADSNIPLLLILTSGAMGFGHVLAIVAFITTLTSGLRTDEQGGRRTLPDAAVRRRHRRRRAGRHRDRPLRRTRLDHHGKARDPRRTARRDTHRRIRLHRRPDRRTHPAAPHGPCSGTRARSLNPLGGTPHPVNRQAPRTQHATAPERASVTLRDHFPKSCDRAEF